MEWVMLITVDFSGEQTAFLQQMVLDMKKYEKINTIEEAVSECVNMAMYENDEHTAAQDGM
jgi:hypothetical protein